MPKEYTVKQLWKLYEKLPEDLQEAIFSEENANSIYNICDKNDVNEVSKIAKLTGNVLLGLLPPKDFSYSLQKELNLKPKKAEKVFQEINSFIFYPVKKSLGDLYETEIELHPKKRGGTKSSKTGKRDLYREQVE